MLANLLQHQSCYSGVTHYLKTQYIPENQPFSRQETSEAETPQDFQISESHENVPEPVQPENESNVPVPAEDDEGLLSESILTCQEVYMKIEMNPCMTG